MKQSYYSSFISFIYSTDAVAQFEQVRKTRTLNSDGF